MPANDSDPNDSDPNDSDQRRVRNDIPAATCQRQSKDQSKEMTDKACIGFRDYQPGDFRALCDIDRLCFPAGIAYQASPIESV